MKKLLILLLFFALPAFAESLKYEYLQTLTPYENEVIRQGFEAPRDFISFEVSDTTNISADTGIKVTSPIMHVQGNGGAVDITADPQISEGKLGQLLILEGKSNVNTVTLEDGNGVQLQGENILNDNDALLLYYDGSDWEEIARNNPQKEVTWSFSSPGGGSGTYYLGGFYKHGTSDNDFDPAITFGTANASYAAHFFVVLGAVTVDEVTITVSGTSINDEGTRTASDSQNIVIPSGTAVNSYYETSKKWLGQVTVTKTGGTAKTCNYGFVKYWDNNNNDFVVTGVEVTGRAGANDSGFDIDVVHHKATGWTFNLGGPATHPLALADIRVDHVTEYQLANGESFAWKRGDLNESVAGSDSEGTLFEIVTSANNAVEQANFILRVRPN